MKRFLKIFLISLGLAVMVCSLYVYYTNRNSTGMNSKQKILKAFYPVISTASRLFGKNSEIKINKQKTKPTQSIYRLSMYDSEGELYSMQEFKGKKILIVNTASDCGYTGQYAELQDLYSKFKDRLFIIGFPANDFGDQEKGSDQEIASFCKKNYGVEFPLAKKDVVKKGKQQQAIFRWLSDPAQNGWNSKAPSWNFTKYLVDENGVLVACFDPAITPSDKRFRKFLEN